MVQVEFNDEFVRALAALDAGANVFITGKAGTGKSTLLRHFLNSTSREAVVVAPTGVAALNVGGQTIHRLFGFGVSVTPEHVASREYFPRRTRGVLSTMDMLVIDEVSMVRADLLDCVDIALQRYGPIPGDPFGGVQMVFVGDPYQLPPVVIGAEEAHFRSRYATPFFFSADALRDFEYQVIELDKVYRQQDSNFVDLLNAIRTGEAPPAVFDALNERYDPSFVPPSDEFWVTLTTTNMMADTVNDNRLAALPTQLHVHLATATGDVEATDKAVPDELRYKIGAQVMCVANDPAGRYVNGSMGVVAAVGHDDDEETVVTIDLLDGGKIWVRPHTWEITRPVIDGGKLTYDVVGTYRQLPFKPAWAVTIHKSQGKTLEKAIVSLGRGTFAEGQLYVALSRCTSLDGLVLVSEVRPHHVKVEREVTRFLARGRTDGASSAGIAFVAAHTTGVDRYDRIVEIGIVIDRGEGLIEEYSTLVNPLRDIGRSGHGITARDVELAPTFVDAWPWLARRMNGCMIIAHGLPLVQTMVEREAEQSGHRVDLGLGIDLIPFAPGDLAAAARKAGLDVPQSPTALDLAELTRRLHHTVVPQDIPVTIPYRAGPAANRIGWITSRDPLPTSLLGEGVHGYADMVAVILAGNSPAFETAAALTAAADLARINASDISGVHQELLNALVAAAQRDHVTSDRERAAVERAAEVLNLPMPNLGTPSKNADTVLTVGTKACFTGSATDLNGQPVDRAALQDIAQQYGVIPVASVTKKGCDVVVAADSTSMSGKAKKARDFQIPVISVTDFLTWVKEQS